MHTLRAAGFDNISLDLLYGIPGQSASDLETDLAEALALAPEHLSYYELEAKPGTRFTHGWGDELERQGEAMEGYFEHVVETLTGAGYRWYETANFCLSNGRAAARDLRAHHNLGYWQAATISVSASVRSPPWTGRGGGTAPGLRGYLEALERGERPPRELELLDDATRARERLMLGLRLDEPLQLDASLEGALDEPALARLSTVG